MAEISFNSGPEEECVPLGQAESVDDGTPPNEAESWLEWASIFG